MRGTRFALGAGALVAAGALASSLAGRPVATVHVAQAPRDLGAAPQSNSPPAPVSRPRVTAAAAPGPRRSVESDSPRPVRNVSRVEAELVALEEEALRRIDVIPILEDAGIDVAALRARPDADEIMRHVAGDELIVRSFERAFFETTVYPSGFPREQALAPVRAQAEGMLAGLGTPEARVESLTNALDAGASDPPEPVYYPAESGRVYQGGSVASGGPDAR